MNKWSYQRDQRYPMGRCVSLRIGHWPEGSTTTLPMALRRARSSSDNIAPLDPLVTLALPRLVLSSVVASQLLPYETNPTCPPFVVYVEG